MTGFAVSVTDARGFGPIKQRNAANARRQQAELLQQYGQSQRHVGEATAAA